MSDSDNSLVGKLLETIKGPGTKLELTLIDDMKERTDCIDAGQELRINKMQAGQQDQVQRKGSGTLGLDMDRKPQELANLSSLIPAYPMYNDNNIPRIMDSQMKDQSSRLFSKNSKRTIADDMPIKGANKREPLTEADFDDMINRRSRFHVRSTTAQDVDPSCRLIEKVVAEQIDQKEQSTAHYADFEVAHASEMSGTSPGRPRKRHRGNAKLPDSFPDSSLPAPTSPDEVTEIADSDEERQQAYVRFSPERRKAVIEGSAARSTHSTILTSLTPLTQNNEGDARASKRVKRNTKEKVREHADKEYTPKDEPAKQVKPSTGEKLRKHADQVDIEKPETEQPAHAPTNEDERDAQASSAIQGVRKQRTGWCVDLDKDLDYPVDNSTSNRRPLVRYHSDANSNPDFSEHKRSAVPVASSSNSMRGIPGGPRPHNGFALKSSSDNPNPPYRMPPVRLAPKVFDLHNPNASGGSSTGPPFKKQRIETDPAVRRVEVHRQAIAIDIEKPSLSRTQTPSARSAHSHTQAGHSSSQGSALGDGGLRQVEVLVNPRKNRRAQRKSSGGSSNSLVSQAGGSNQSMRPPPQRSIVLDDSIEIVEDPDDPISNSEDEIRIMHSNQISKATPQVVIAGYSGTAHCRPAREKVSSGRAASTGSTSAKSTELKSRHFSQDEPRDDSGVASGGHEYRSQEIRSTRQRNKTSSNGIGVSAIPKIQPLSISEDRDELASDEAVTGTSHSIKRKRRQSSAMSTEARHHVAVYLDNSDDENHNADIIPTQLYTGRDKVRKLPEGHFKLLQVFSEAHQWLVLGQSPPWTLIQDLDNGNLTVLDNHGQNIKELELFSRSFRQIHRSKVSGSVMIIKSADRTAKNADKVCLELLDAECADDFDESLKVSPSVARKPSDSLEKIFENYLNNQAKAQLKQEPKDKYLQIAQEKTRQKIRNVFDKVVQDRSNQPRLIDQMEVNEAGSHVSGTLPANRRNTRSKIGGAPEHSLRQSLVPEVLSEDFYGSHATRSSHRVSTGETAPKQRAKELTPISRWTEENSDWHLDRENGTEWQNSIIYPKESKNRATVDMQDISRLDEGEFLNDNLITFYMQWLEQQMLVKSPELSKRIYFQNTFFYEKLSQPLKGKRGINYEAVERWTNKVDLFTYDYIIVPVNEHTHWYVAIICNAPKLLNPDSILLEDPQSPEPIHDSRQLRLDDGSNMKTPYRSPTELQSVGSSEFALTGSIEAAQLEGDPMVVDNVDKSHEIEHDEVLQKPEIQTAILDTNRQPQRPESPQDLAREAVDIEDFPRASASSKSTKAKRKYNPQRFDLKEPKIITLDSLGISHSPTCTNLRNYLIAEMKSKLDKEMVMPSTALGMKAINIPQQKNFCDCGLFLLSYLEQFLKDPDAFAEALLRKDDIDSSKFNFTTAPELRKNIRGLLFELQQEQIAADEAKYAAKKAAKMGRRNEALTPGKSTSREASASARASLPSEARSSGKISAQPESMKSTPKHEHAGRSPQPGKSVPEPPQCSSSERRHHEPHQTQPSEHLKKDVDFLMHLGEASQAHIEVKNPAADSSIISSVTSAAKASLSTLRRFSGFKNNAETSERSQLPAAGKSGHSETKGGTAHDAWAIEDNSPKKGKHPGHQSPHRSSPVPLMEDKGFDIKNQHLSSPLSSARKTPPTSTSPESSPTFSISGRPISPNDQHLYKAKHGRASPQQALRPAVNSPPLHSPPKLVSNSIEGSVEAGKNDQSEDDVMLLDCKAHPMQLPLLSDSPSTPHVSPKRRRSGMGHGPDSQVRNSPRHDKPLKSFSDGPFKHRALRDGADMEIIGSKGKRTVGGSQVNEFGGTHTVFSSP